MSHGARDAGAAEQRFGPADFGRVGVLGMVGDGAHGHQLPAGAQQRFARFEFAGQFPGPVGPERVLGRGPRRVGPYLRHYQFLSFSPHSLR